MTNQMRSLAGYSDFFSAIKARFASVQLKAAVAVNTALLQFYWDLGAEIVSKQHQHAWGSGFLNQLSEDLSREFPDVKGFSRRNLEQIRRWHLFWANDAAIAKQAASQLLAIPWWHNIVIITQCKTHAEALYYVQQTQAHGWSRSVLTHQIESGLYQREGRALTNFAQTLPAPQSELAAQETVAVHGRLNDGQTVLGTLISR